MRGVAVLIGLAVAVAMAGIGYVVGVRHGAQVNSPEAARPFAPAPQAVPPAAKLDDQTLITDDGEIKATPSSGYKVDLCGVIRLERQYDLPNFGETPEIDKKVEIAVLTLTKKIFLNRSDSGLFNGPYLVKNMQVYPVSKVVKFKGKKVCLSGDMFEGITGHHFYPILLDLNDKGSNRGLVRLAPSPSE